MELTIVFGLAALAGWLWLAYRCISRGRWRWVLAALGVGAAFFVVGMIVAQAAWPGTGGLEDLGTALSLAIVVIAGAILATVVVLVRGAFGDERIGENPGANE